MRHYIFTNNQKETIQNILKDIKYSPYVSHFSFVEITGNKWVLPETVLESQDALSHITTQTKDIIASLELREIDSGEQLNLTI